MSNPSNNNPTVTESKVVARKRPGISLVWLIPLIAAAVGAWIAINTIRNQGPVITITFKSAEGLEANKTKLRFNGIEIGEVHAVELAKDYKTVIATAQLHPKTEGFLRKDTKFWVVRPQISGANVSGLGTLISGAYIGMEIGSAKETTRDFKALDDAPMETGGVKGSYYTLKSPQLGSLNKGSPIYFRRLQAGQVTGYELEPDGKQVAVKVFVQSPYDQFVTADTRFWEASGVDASLSAAGIRVQTESLLAIVVGGIAFETPLNDPIAPPAGTNAVFTLFKDREQAFRSPPVNPQSYVLVFKESVRGLNVGAPVEFAGIPIGEVVDIKAQFNAQTYEFTVPVTIRMDLPRFGVKLLGLDPGADHITHRETAMNALIERGLRAQLRTGSLISGAKVVALDFFPDAPKVALDWTQNPVHLPTRPGQLDSLQEDIANIAKKINQLPFEQIGADVHKTVTDLDKTIVGLQGTITNADRLVISAGRMIAPDSALNAQLPGLLQEAGGAARALRVLADYLERHPESLLHGKPDNN